MFRLNDKFRGVMSPAKWRNKVSAFLNNLCGDGFIEVKRPDDPSPTTPPSISLKVESLVNAIKDMHAFTYALKLRLGVDASGRTRVLIYLGDSPVVRIAGEDRKIADGVSAESDGWYWITTSTLIDWDSSRSIWLRELTPYKDIYGVVHDRDFGIFTQPLTDTGKISVCLGKVVYDEDSDTSEVYQNTLGALTLQNVYLGKGESDTEVAIAQQPAATAVTLWDRDGAQQKNDKKNFVIRVLSCVAEPPSSEAYCYRVSFVKLEFDRDGRLYKASREAANQYFDLVDYDYIRDMPDMG